MSKQESLPKSMSKQESLSTEKNQTKDKITSMSNPESRLKCKFISDGKTIGRANNTEKSGAKNMEEKVIVVCDSECKKNVRSNSELLLLLFLSSQFCNFSSYLDLPLFFSWSVITDLLAAGFSKFSTLLDILSFEEILDFSLILIFGLSLSFCCQKVCQNRNLCQKVCQNRNLFQLRKTKQKTK
jgi:hypothetical protein